MPTEHFYPSIDELNRVLAAHIAERLTDAVSRRGKASIAVSGGSTPKALFGILCKQPVPWSHVTVTLADERWVEPAHKDSNEKLVRDHLLKDRARAARFLPLKNPAPTADQGLRRCEKDLARLDGPLDILILGMGDDGHTASLFPGAKELEAGLDLKDNAADCLVVNPPEAPYQRVSLSLKRLLHSREIILHITGENKLRVYRDALSTNDAPAIREKPVRAVLHQIRVPVAVYWAPK